MKFLVVEDNELDVEKIARCFKRLKIDNELIHARDGYEALDMLRGTGGKSLLAGPYVILLDLNMPRMNGLEFLKEVRSDESLLHTPVVVLTTSNRMDDIEAAYQNYVSGYLVKPMDIQQMYQTLGALKTYWDVCELPHGRATF